jgi:hypothetical protein
MQMHKGLMCWLARLWFWRMHPRAWGTISSGALQREVKARVLLLAASTTRECKRYTTTDIEVLELHSDGKVSTERWAVERCGERVHYRVDLPPSRGGLSFVVSPER